MINYFAVMFGMSRLTGSEELFLVSVMVVFCTVIGMVCDVILKDLGFGALLNGVLLCIFLLLSLVLYHQLYQPLRYADPLIVLSISTAGAFMVLFAAAMAKNMLQRHV